MLSNIFDKLKEAEYFKQVTNFKSLIMSKNFKEMKWLKILQVKAEAYLESKRVSTMGLFCEYT